MPRHRNTCGAPSGPAPRPCSSGIGRAAPSSWTATTSPGLAESSSSRCSTARSGVSGPATAASMGPARAAWAVASSQPAARGAWPASGGSNRARMLAARVRCSGRAGEGRVGQQGTGQRGGAAGGGAVERFQAVTAALGGRDLRGLPRSVPQAAVGREPPAGGVQNGLGQPIPAGVPGNRIEREQPLGAEGVVLQQTADSARHSVVGDAQKPAGAIRRGPPVHALKIVRDPLRRGHKLRACQDGAGVGEGGDCQPVPARHHLVIPAGLGPVPARLRQQRAHPLPQRGVPAGHLPARMQRRTVGAHASGHSDVHQGRHGGAVGRAQEQLQAAGSPQVAGPLGVHAVDDRVGVQRRRQGHDPGVRSRRRAAAGAGAGPVAGASPRRARSQSAVSPAIPAASAAGYSGVPPSRTQWT